MYVFVLLVSSFFYTTCHVPHDAINILTRPALIMKRVIVCFRGYLLELLLTKLRYATMSAASAAGDASGNRNIETWHEGLQVSMLQVVFLTPLTVGVHVLLFTGMG